MRPVLYATPAARCYHANPCCIGLNSWWTWDALRSDANPPTVSSAAAAARSLRPCKVCKPAPLLRVVA